MLRNLVKKFKSQSLTEDEAKLTQTAAPSEQITDAGSGGRPQLASPNSADQDTGSTQPNLVHSKTQTV